jgi:hypothetical protein
LDTVVLKINLSQTYAETGHLFQITMTVPLTTAKPERCFSTPNTAKSFLRNTVGEGDINSLVLLTVEWDRTQMLPDLTAEEQANGLFI